MEDVLQVFKAGWRISKDSQSERSNYKADPYLLINNLNQSKTEEILLHVGKDIRFYNSDEKYCIGFEESQGIWVPCPLKTETSNSQLQCEACEQDDFYSCRATCQGLQCFPKSLEAKSLCAVKETYLYLTYVGGYFKVGVTLNPIRRWLDQGSLYGMLLYRGYGLETRLYEQTISKAIGIKLSTTVSDKMKILGSALPSRSQIRNNFANKLEEIRKLKLFEIKNEPLLYNLTKYYGKITTLKQHPIIDNKVIKGKIIGVIGRLLVVKDKNSVYVTNLKELYGKIITTDKPTGDYSKQRTIFDYRD